MRSPSAGVAIGARCCVAVICGGHVVSQMYPASVPVEVFFEDVVELIADDLRKRGGPSLDAGLGYELQRANGVRLDITKTLDELGVHDGETLVLAVAGDGEAFEAQCESLSTGLAQIGKRLFPPVTDRTAVQTAIAVLGLVAAVVLGLVWYVRIGSESAMPALVAGGYGTGLAIAAVSVRRWWPEHRELLSGLGWLAAPLLAFGVATAAPGGLAAPHLFIAALAGLALTVVVAVLTGCHSTGATFVSALCAIAGIVAAVRMWTPISEQLAGVGTLSGLLFLLTAAPTVALWVARVRPPHFGSVTGRDLFRRREGMTAAAVCPVDDGADDDLVADPTPSGAGIAAAALRANGVLTGLCLAAAIALPLAVWATLWPGHPRDGGAAVLGVLFVVIFISRARAFADRRQAVALVCGAASAFCAGVARYVLSEPVGSALFCGTLVLFGFGAAGLAAALLVPVTPFTPLVRMATEWLELVAIVAALPLAAWVGDLFTWVRMR